MAKTLERDKAIKLRKQGLSIKEIAQLLYVSKSTVSYWCRGIELTAEQKEYLQQQMRTMGARKLFLCAELKRKDRLDRQIKLRNEGKVIVGDLSTRDLLMIGLGLYWGEGYKVKSKELGFTNSDLGMIQIYIKWLQDIFCVEKSNLILRVSINKKFKYKENIILAYWSRNLHIPLNQFTKTSFIKSISKKEFLNSQSYYGTLRVKVRRGFDIKERIIGALESLGYHSI